MGVVGNVGHASDGVVAMYGPVVARAGELLRLEVVEEAGEIGVVGSAVLVHDPRCLHEGLRHSARGRPLQVGTPPLCAVVGRVRVGRDDGRLLVVAPHVLHETLRRCHAQHRAVAPLALCVAAQAQRERLQRKACVNLREGSWERNVVVGELGRESEVGGAGLELDEECVDAVEVVAEDSEVVVVGGREVLLAYADPLHALAVGVGAEEALAEHLGELSPHETAVEVHDVEALLSHHSSLRVE
mmetsp:Transcript_12623/g.50467  ORF Transcript_12623/g.50467 Transcript_12623/m.50467 type:complete len:243 (+) Transcript_12623:4609-5337(+)